MQWMLRDLGRSQPDMKSVHNAVFCWSMRMNVDFTCSGLFGAKKSGAFDGCWWHESCVGHKWLPADLGLVTNCPSVHLFHLVLWSWCMSVFCFNPLPTPPSPPPALLALSLGAEPQRPPSGNQGQWWLPNRGRKARPQPQEEPVQGYLTMWVFREWCLHQNLWLHTVRNIST